MGWRRWWATGVIVLGVTVVPFTHFPQARGLSPGSLAGNWGLFFAGQSVRSGQPESGIGVAVLGADGSISGSEIFNTGTEVCDVKLDGRYTIDPNGTGRMTISAESPLAECSFSFDAAFVVLDNGTLLKLVGTNPGFVILTEEWRKRPEY